MKNDHDIIFKVKIKVRLDKVQAEILHRYSAEICKLMYVSICKEIINMHFTTLTSV